MNEKKIKKLTIKNLSMNQSIGKDINNSEYAWYEINQDGNLLITKQSFRIILCGKKQRKILKSKIFNPSFITIKRCQITLG